MRFLIPKALRAKLRKRNLRRSRRLHAECLEQRRVLTSYIVDTLVDSTAADGLISLREAIGAANSNAAFGDAPAGQAGPGVSDTISFAPELSGQVLTLSGGVLSISDALTIYDTNDSPIIIDGDASQQVFFIDNSATVSISDLTIRDGAGTLGGAVLVNSGSQLSVSNAVLQNNFAEQGGAIYNDGGTVTILGATLTSNQTTAANGSGGAIFSAAGSVTLVNSSVTFNSANRAGGGIEVVDGSLSLLRTSLISNDVSGNAGTPSPGNGGGIHVTGNATTTLAYSVIFGNTAASEGGGLWNQVGSTLTIRDSVISSNEALGDSATEGGGGVFNNGGVVDISGVDTIISDNFASGASGSGGGVFNDGGVVSITDATIQANVANRAGGGIEATAGSTTDLLNVLLTENNAGVGPDAVAAPGNGGGFHITGAGDASIIGGEVSDNVAAREGGGLWNGAGLMTIDGTEIFGNVASGPAADDGGGGIFNNGGPMMITGAVITDNFADGEAGSGGGLLSLDGAIEIIATTFSFNSANRAGGGIEIVDGTLELIDSNLISNDVDGGAGAANPGNGGGLHVTGVSTINLEGGSVFGNLAASEGGGLWNQAGSTLTIRDSVISSNEALGDSATEGGGGVFNNGGVVDISGVDTIISDNFASGASGSGGGVFNDGGEVTITDATIQANVANRAGGGIEATAGSTTDLINVLLTENNAGVGPDAVAAPGNGGGFHITGAGDASIVGGEVSDNVAAREGGGLWNGAGLMTIDGTEIFGNVASGPAADDGGGGIFNNGGPMMITGAVITDNVADGESGSGGGLLSLDGAIEITATTFSFNSANRAGGGIEIVDGTLELIDSNLISNDVDGGAGAANPGNGGGLHVTGVSTITLEGGSVFGNLAASEGGGLWNQVGSTLTIRDSVISSNEALGDSATEGGGGVFNNGGVVEISGVDTIISDNFASGASGSGGGVFNDGGEVTITDATIQANVANRAGGGIEATAGSTTDLINVLLTENNAGVGPDAVAAPGNGGGFHITGAGDASIIGGEVSDNVAAREGGGLWNGAGLMTIDGTEIFGNVASGPAADDGGGGIFNNGGPMMITGAVITDNFADGELGSGGGLLSLDGAIEITATTFSFNSANRAGGGIEIVDGSLDLLDSNLISNDVDGGAGAANPGNGGGLHVTGVSTINLEGGSVFGNLAASEGGGLWNQAGSTLTIRDSVISSNEALGDSATEGGGGVFNNGGVVDISGVDTIISDNFASGASGSGGGVFNDGGEVTITDATIQANVANRAGGGIEATAGSTTDLINVLLTENNAGVGPDAVAAPGNGGGFHITGAGDASIIGGEVSDNVAAREGGGLWNGAGLMTIDGTEIFGNVASGPAADDGGGGIFNNGGPMMITGAVITDNFADGEAGSGGGLLSLDGAIEITATTFSFNSANRAGGGIEIVDGTLELIDSNLISNDVDGGAGAANPGNGGGLHVTGVSTINLEGGSVFGNLAASEGGGLWNQVGSTLTIRDSVISSNEALGDSATEGGGGVFNNGGIVDISGVDTIISDNFASGASGSGGGVFNDGGEVTITDATIQANVANRAGGGIEATAGSTTDLINVLLTENNAGVGPDAVAAPGNGGGFHITGAGDASIIGGEVSDNVAAREGGGLWNGAGLMTIDGTEIFGNVASGPAADDGGGGIFNNGGPMTITGAVITDNSADGESGSGGGLLSLDGAVEITATTFSFNSANRAGGGIEIVDGTLELIDSNLISNDVDGGAGGANPGNGGGLHTSASATVMAAGGVYSGNRAASEGGAIWIQATGSLTLSDDALLVDNTASGDAADEGGGAIFNNGGVLNLAAITLFNNSANGASGSGGAILNLGGTVTGVDLVIGFNTASRAGGGIEDRAGILVLSDSALTGNSTGAAPGNGGALHITGASQVEIFGSEVNLNSAAFEGGGLWNSSTGSLSIEGSTVSNNSAPSGGGLFNDGDGGIITVDSSTINGNAAELAGGGLLSEGGTVSLLNSTVSSNRSAEGGGINIQAGVLDLTSSTIASNSASSIGGGVHVLDGSMASLQNSLLASNFAATDPDIAGTFESLGHNLISDLGAAMLNGDQTGNLVNLAASLAPLADNGGPTRTHALLPGSPAIDAGTDNVPATDQRGTARPQGAGFDIGAFEAVSGGGSGANFFQTSDVNADGVVSPLDALLLVNALNRDEGPAGEPNSGSGSMVALDVNRDGALTPLDALVVINVLNGNADGSQRPSSEKERDEALAFYDLWASEIEEELSLEIANYDELVELLASHRA